MSTSATRRVLSILTLLAATLALPSFRALAQEGTAGKVVITVEDASGAVVPGATLTLVEHQTNDTRTANTNGSGDYTFENLPIGVYTLTIGRSGYSTRVYSAVIVQAGQVTDLKAQLTVGSTTTTVQVTGQTSPCFRPPPMKSARPSIQSKSRICPSMAAMSALSFRLCPDSRGRAATARSMACRSRTRATTWTAW